MFDTVLGLPVHALVVHAVVVLVPLAAAGLVVVALRPSWRGGATLRVRWCSLATAGLAMVPVATQSGTRLEDRLNAGGVVAKQITTTQTWASWSSTPPSPCGCSPLALLYLDRARVRGRAVTVVAGLGVRRRRCRSRAGDDRRPPRLDGGLELHDRQLPVGHGRRSSTGSTGPQGRAGRRVGRILRSSGTSRLRSRRRSDASRAGSLCPAATQSSSAHSGSSWRAGPWACRCPILEVGEGMDDPVEVDVGQPEAAHPGGVDDPAAAGQLQRDRGGGRVPAPAGDRVHSAGRPAGPGYQRVDHRRLPDTGVPDQHADAGRADGGAARRAARRGGRRRGRRRGRGRSRAALRRGEVGLGQAEQAAAARRRRPRPGTGRSVAAGVPGRRGR